MWKDFEVIFKNGESKTIENIKDKEIDDFNILHLIDYYGDEVALISMDNIAGIFEK